ncbi:MerR family DNA-binding transcriptional regulator, partial [Nonomuraea sp. NPDC001684]
MVDEDLLPIGQFARLGRLSVKQLRHYDELGLLRPAYVDEVTGYHSTSWTRGSTPPRTSPSPSAPP